MSSPEGWEGLTQAVSEAPRADDMDILYGKVFKSSEGQKVLSHLRSITGMPSARITRATKTRLTMHPSVRWWTSMRWQWR